MAKKLDKRDHRPALTVSVIIPCTQKHVAHLPALINALRAQTRKADQIVVATSGCAAAELPTLDADVVHSSTPCTAGSNRNRGSAAARGDVVIYQDADDLPHPQRVEIVAGLFEKYQIEHLMHFYYRLTPGSDEFSVKEAAKRTRYRTKPTAGGITNGNPAVARAVLRAVQWPEYPQIGEDVEFNARAYAHTKWTAVTELPLLTYRHNLSSFGGQLL